MEQFVGLYKVKGIISNSAVELYLLATMRIHPVVNTSRIKRYIKQVDSQRKEVLQPVVIEGEKE